MKAIGKASYADTAEISFAVWAAGILNSKLKRVLKSFFIPIPRAYTKSWMARPGILLLSVLNGDAKSRQLTSLAPLLTKPSYAREKQTFNATGIEPGPPA